MTQIKAGCCQLRRSMVDWVWFSVGSYQKTLKMVSAAFLALTLSI